MAKEAEQNVMEAFRKGFGGKLEGFLVRKWNENFEVFNVRENAQYHCFIGNICEATDIYDVDSEPASNLRYLQEAIELSIVSVSIPNLADIIRSILSRFWSTDSFAFEDGELACRSAIDILQAISHVKDASECMTTASQDRVLRRVAVQ